GFWALHDVAENRHARRNGADQTKVVRSRRERNACPDRCTNYELGMRSTCPTWIPPPVWILLALAERSAPMLMPYCCAIPDRVSPRETLCMSWASASARTAFVTEATRVGASGTTAFAPAAALPLAATSISALVVRCRRSLRCSANHVPGGGVVSKYCFTPVSTASANRWRSVLLPSRRSSLRLLMNAVSTRIEGTSGERSTTKLAPCTVLRYSGPILPSAVSTSLPTSCAACMLAPCERSSSTEASMWLLSSSETPPIRSEAFSLFASHLPASLCLPWVESTHTDPPRASQKSGQELAWIDTNRSALCSRAMAKRCLSGTK